MSASEGGTLAVDAGQTGIRLRWTPSASGGPTAREADRPPVVTDSPVVPQVARAIASFADETGARPRTVAVGCSGLAPDEDAAGLRRLLGGLGVEHVLLAHDSITGYLGALGLDHGVVVAAGTGVVTLGVGPHGVARVDGWGNVMGDAGSGYWIGQRALEAAMRAYDGRGAETPLLDLLRERWPDPEVAYLDLQAAPDRVALVASFARQVDRCARDGDTVAVAILDDACRALVESAVTALRRAGVEPPAAACATVGGVFRSSAIATGFLARLRRHYPDLTPSAAAGTVLDGAAMLPHVDARHPLFPHISRV